jgi:hypothetical protein
MITCRVMNLLYYGDNLDVLRRHVKDETIDLIYLDPPFNSNQDYNVLFAEHGTRSAAQIKAFEDTWRWDEVAAAAYEETVEGGGDVSRSAHSSARTTCADDFRRASERNAAVLARAAERGFGS